MPPRAAWIAALLPVCLGAITVVMPARAANDGPDWAFQLTPYAWIAGLKGNTGTSPAVPTVPIDVAPSDVIDDLEATLMLVFSAQRGRHGVYADVFYADIQADETLLPSPVDLSLRVGAETTLLSLAYQYEFIGDEDMSAAILAGARYWNIDNRLQFRGGPGSQPGREFSSGESWTDPFIGVKGSIPVRESRFYLTGGAGIGGFGMGSERFHEVTAAVAYRWSDAIATVLGYRHLDVDYDEDGFIFDVVQKGWQLGLTWSF